MQKNHLVPKNCVMRSAPCISVPPNDKIGAQRSGSDFDDGPSGAIRTRGFQLPKLAPYRLGYTRKYEVLAFVLLLYHARRCGQACGHKPFFQRKAGKGKPPQPQRKKGFPAFTASPRRPPRTCSQSWRPTNSTPGNSSEETRFLPLPPFGESFTFAPSFFLSKSKPLRRASICHY